MYFSTNQVTLDYGAVREGGGLKLFLCWRSIMRITVLDGLRRLSFCNGELESLC
ncbi:hypothetical protein Mapa_006952 [Marchantia paleacea]|nr:hypothetical protein Mapa_006952 [Marchantia paleacea]